MGVEVVFGRRACQLERSDGRARGTDGSAQEAPARRGRAGSPAPPRRDRDLR